MAALALLLLALAFAFGHPADAHGGSAVIDVLEATSRNGRVVEIRVAVTYSADHERAEAALLEAVGHGPNGRTTGPIELARRPGGVYRLRTNVPKAGTWRFDIVSRFPPGSTTVNVRVGGSSNNNNVIWWLTLPAVAILAVLLLVLRLRARTA